jgi:hypothetical protein
MKNNVLKYYITAVFFCSTFIMFAQDPGNGSTGDPLEGSDPVGAPIDGYLWVLAAIGLVYVFFRLRAFIQQENAPNK